MKSMLVSEGLAFGPAYDEYEPRLQGQQHMMRNDATGLCQMCFETSPSIAKLIRAGAQKERLVELANGLIVDAVLDVCGKITAADVTKDATSCSAKQCLLVMRDTISSHARDTSVLVPTEAIDDINHVVIPEMLVSRSWMNPLLNWRYPEDVWTCQSPNSFAKASLA